MGAPMAQRLLAAEIGLRLFDRQHERARVIASHDGCAVATLHDAVPAGGVVITMVPDDAALLQVALSTGGVLDSLGNGIHLSTSTVSPATAQLLETRYREAGATFLSATVLGRPDLARRGELTVFLAGEPDAKSRVTPLLLRLSRRVHDVGSCASAANVVKVGANFLIMAAIEAMAEAAAVVELNGVDRATFLRMIAQTPLFAGTVYAGYGAMIGEHRYQPALFPVDLGLKDANLVLDVAREAGLATPLAELVQENLLTAIDRGWAQEDWSVIGRIRRSIAADGSDTDG